MKDYKLVYAATGKDVEDRHGCLISFHDKNVADIRAKELSLEICPYTRGKILVGKNPKDDIYSPKSGHFTLAVYVDEVDNG